MKNLAFPFALVLLASPDGLLHMADLDASIAAIDTATTKLGGNLATLSTAVDGVSSRFDALKGQITAGMTADQVAAAHAAIDADTTKLDAVSTALDQSVAVLNAIGTTPATPVPVPVPEPPVV